MRNAAFSTASAVGTAALVGTLLLAFPAGAETARGLDRVEAVVPAGALIDVEFLDAASSVTSEVGETVHLRVADDVWVGDEIVVHAGALVEGTVTEVVSAERLGGRARLAVEPRHLVLPDGSRIALSATFAHANGRDSDAAVPAPGRPALAGAVLGRSTASRYERGETTVLGSLFGGAAIASTTEGDEVLIPAGTFLTLRLERPLRLTIRR